MLKQFKYAPKEIETLIKSITVLCDTREQRNEHITKLFNTHNILHIPFKLDYGDYSFMIPANQELGIPRDLYFNEDIVIERKGCLEELSGNLSTDRQRFEDEFLRCRAKITLLVEGGSYPDILGHNYNTKMSPKSFFASLLSFKQRYNIDVQFITKEHSGQFIYSTFYYYLRELIA